jgi:hypothetical protein
MSWNKLLLYYDIFIIILFKLAQNKAIKPRPLQTSDRELYIFNEKQDNCHKLVHNIVKNNAFYSSFYFTSNMGRSSNYGRNSNVLIPDPYH